MQKKLWLIALGLAVFMSAPVAWADGNFYVIGGGGAVGTKITSLPYTILQSGFYYLGSDLTTAGEGITVDVDHVTIDLMGFSLIRSGSPGGNGIYMNHRNDVEIRNGSVRGFSIGLYGVSASQCTNLRAINIRTTGNKDFGIALFGYNHLVRGCTSSNSGTGIFVYSGTIANSVAYENSLVGIEMDGPGNLIGNTAIKNTTHNFWVSHDSNILVDQNCASGLTTNYSGTSTKTEWGVNAGRP